MPIQTPPPPPPPSAPSPLPAPPTAPRQLVRLPEEGRIAGVAAGLGAYLGIDPTLVRIGFVVLTIATGAGIPAYIVAWVLMPSGTPSDGSRTARRRGADHSRGPGIVIITAVAIMLVTQVDLFSTTSLLAAMLIGVGVLLFTDTDRRAGARPMPWRGRGPSHCADPGEPTASAYHPYAGAWPPHVRTDPDVPATASTSSRSILGRLGFALLLLATGATGVLFGLTPTRMLGLVITVAGITLVVGTVLGRTRVWILIGLVASLALVLSGVAGERITAGGGVGDRQAVPTTVADVQPVYEMFVGSQVVDLSAIGPLESDLHTTVRMTAGEVNVIVPTGVPVVVTGSLSAGDYDVLGAMDSGTRLTIRVDDGGVPAGTDPVDGPSNGTLLLDLDIGLGDVTVTRAGRR